MRSIPTFFKRVLAGPCSARLFCTSALLVGLSFGLTLLPMVASAAGFFLPTRGVEATGRGGASVATHRADLNALWYNPAGLSLLEKRELTLDMAVIGIQVEHQRAPRQMPNGSTRTYEPVENEAPPTVIPQFLIGGPTPLKNLSWAAGAYTPYTGASRYPVDGAQRYVMVDNVGSVLGYVHGAVAWQVNGRLALGLGLQNFMGSFRVVTVASGYAGVSGDPEDEDFDLLAVTTINTLFSPTANLGATYTIHPRLRAGLAVQLPHRFRDRDATIDTSTPEHPAYDNSEITNNKADISLTFPFFVRAGLRFVHDSFDAELAFVYQHWSLLDEVQVRPDGSDVIGVPALGTVPIEDFTVPQRFQNTFSLHLGGEYGLSETFSLRGGYVFERGAVPDRQYSVFAIDPDKHQLSLGASLRIASFTFDLTAAGLLMPSKTITNSQVRQINPSDPDGELTIVVANGTYDHFGYIGGLGVSYQF